MGVVGNGTWNPGLILDTTRLGLPGRTAAPEVDPPTSTTPGPGRNSRQSGLAVPGPGRVWVMELGRNGLKTRTVHRRPAGPGETGLADLVETLFSRTAGGTGRFILGVLTVTSGNC